MSATTIASIKTICETEIIDAYEATCNEFLKKVLNVDGALVTDISDLSDFCLAGDYPQGTLDIQKMTQAEVYDAWDAWVIQEIKDIYGISLAKTNVSLVSICNQIEQNRPPTIH